MRWSRSLVGAAMLCACLATGCQKTGPAAAPSVETGQAGAVATPAIPPAPANPGQPVEAATPAMLQAGPGGDAARAVVVDYYAALNGGDHAAAYARWSDGGAASGQGFEDFAKGYANTLAIQAQVGEAHDLQGAAGSQYIEVPVQLVASQRDGSKRQYRGKFFLRAVLADGATAEQRRWHLASADIQRLPDPVSR